MRPSWVEVDLAAISHNLSAFAGMRTPVCAVVKADGYGHGDVPVAETVIAAGAKRLAVALVEEGIRLREAGINVPILLLSEPPAEDIAEALHWQLTPTVYRRATLDQLDGADRLAIEVKVDTGMHRVGVSPSELGDLLVRIESSSSLHLQAIWSHLAVADEDPDFTKLQIDLFESLTNGLSIDRHLANTAGAALYPAARYDEIRIGLGLYGMYPCDEVRALVDLRPAMRVVSHVSHLQNHEAGSRPSYGRRRSLPVDGAVATVPIGYADGVPRSWSEGTVLIRGRRYPMAGTVTMDQIMVDVGADPTDLGDEVVLIGRQGGEEISADEWAQAGQTISYEILTGIGPRLPRRYLQ